MSKKLIDLDKANRLIKSLDSRILNKITAEQLRALDVEASLLESIQKVETMLGGKYIVYLTQSEYDALPDSEKDRDDVAYVITDAKVESHEHINKEFLDSLSQDIFEDIYSSIESEVYRAMAREDELQASIDAYDTKLHDHPNKDFLDNLTQDTIEDLNSRIDAETYRATAREDQLEFMLDAYDDQLHDHANKSFLDSLTQDTLEEISSEITAERNRAIGREDEIQTIVDGYSDSIHSHTNKSFLDTLTQEVIEDLNSDIITEINRATAAEADMQAMLDYHETRVHDHSNKNFLDTLNTGTIESIHAEIQSERNRAIKAEEDLRVEMDDKISKSDSVTRVTAYNNELILTTASIQICENIGTEVLLIFPTVSEFTEIHLYFSAEEDVNIIIPDDCRWRLDANIEAGCSYELVCTYNTMEWLINVICYSRVVTKVPCAALNISASSLSVDINDVTEIKMLTATPVPSTTTESIYWRSTDETVLIVSGNGMTALLTPVGLGKCTVIATCGNCSASCNVEVTEIDYSCTGIVLDRYEIVFSSDINETTTLVAIVTPSNTKDEITWRSTNPAIATVENGVVTPKSKGTCSIIAACGAHTAICTVTVNIVPCIDILVYDDVIDDNGIFTITELGLVSLPFDLYPSDTTEYPMVFGSGDEYFDCYDYFFNEETGMWEAVLCPYFNGADGYLSIITNNVQLDIPIVVDAQCTLDATLNGYGTIEFCDQGTSDDGVITYSCMPTTSRLIFTPNPDADCYPILKAVNSQGEETELEMSWTLYNYYSIELEHSCNYVLVVVDASELE